MDLNAETLGAVYTHTHTMSLEDRVFASFFIQVKNLIIGKIIDRANFVYMFLVQLCNLRI